MTSPAPSDDPYATFGPLPSTSVADLNVDEPLERTIPTHVLGVPVAYIESLSGLGSFAVYTQAEGIQIISLPLWQRVPRFYARLRASLASVTTAFGITQFPAKGFGTGRVQVFAFRIPDATPEALTNAWLDATRDTTAFYLQNARLAGRSVVIVDMGREVETLYAAGNTLYMIATEGTYEPDFSTYVGDLIGQLP